VADLIPRTDGTGERGQLLLIAAFIIAVSFVVLALVVNSAIFTENLATRDDVAGSGDALESRHEVEVNVGAIIERLNNGTAPSTSGFVDSVENVSRQGGIQQSAQGRFVEIRHDRTSMGTKIAQDRSGRFTNESDSPGDWTVAGGVPGTRSLRFNVTDESDLLGSTDHFRMVVNGSNDNEWTLTVEEETIGGDTVDIIVNPPTASPRTCQRDVDPFLVIDVTGGTAGDQRCQALDRLDDGTPMWFAAGIEPPYRIDFENPAEINGTYSMVVNMSSVVSDVGTDPGDRPYSTSAIYSAVVEYGYYTSDVGYEAEIRVAPGEVPP